MALKYVDETIKYRRLQNTIKRIKAGETKKSFAQMSLAIAFPVVQNQANFMSSNINEQKTTDLKVRNYEQLPNLMFCFYSC